MEDGDILIVDDDESLLEVTRDFLADNGFTVKTCSKGCEAVRLLKNSDFRLVILDINLPDLIGFDICSLIRKTSKVPVIFLSARVSETDKITGLGLGADDYISKPYSLNELLSRIKAQMRRKYEYDGDREDECAKSGNTDGDVFTFDDLEVDLSGRRVRISGAEKDLTAREFDLLAYLIKNRNKSISKENIFNEVWGFDYIGEINTLSVHIRRLREKIERDPSNPRHIKTVWSYGFRFEV